MASVASCVFEEGNRATSLKDLDKEPPQHSSKEEEREMLEIKLVRTDTMEAEMIDIPSTKCFFNEKPSSKAKVSFVNKKRPSASLQLSREDVEKLRNGKELQFFNSHSMTFMKVKTLQKPHPIKLDVKMEAHHNHVLRVAEVSGGEISLSDCCSITDSTDHIITHDSNSPSNSLEEEVCHMCPFVAGTSNEGPSQEKKILDLLSASCSNPDCPFLIPCRQRGLYRFKWPTFRSSSEGKTRAIKYVRQKIKGKCKQKMKKKQAWKERLTRQQPPKSCIVGEKRIKYHQQQEDDPPSKKLVVPIACFSTGPCCSVKSVYSSSSSRKGNYDLSSEPKFAF